MTRTRRPECASSIDAPSKCQQLPHVATRVRWACSSHDNRRSRSWAICEDSRSVNEISFPQSLQRKTIRSPLCTVLHRACRRVTRPRRFRERAERLIGRWRSSELPARRNLSSEVEPSPGDEDYRRETITQPFGVLRSCSSICAELRTTRDRIFGCTSVTQVPVTTAVGPLTVMAAF
jgi:hypothetical protein